MDNIHVYYEIASHLIENFGSRALDILRGRVEAHVTDDEPEGAAFWADVEKAVRELCAGKSEEQPFLRVQTDEGLH